MARLKGTPFLPRESEPCTQLATRCGGKPTFPKGSTDCDAKGLEIILAGVSYRRECVRGRGECQPVRAAREQRSLRWRCT